MDDETAPKRVTRSRATTKPGANKEPEIKVTTASTRARTTRNAAPAAEPKDKRKTRAEDVEEAIEEDTAHDEMVEAPATRTKSTRGRKKVISPGPETEDPAMESAPAASSTSASARVTRRTRGTQEAVKPTEEDNVAATLNKSLTRSARGRVKKAEEPEVTVEEAVEEAPAPAKTTRGRATKTVEEMPAPAPAPEPAKTVRARTTRRVKVAEDGADEKAPSAPAPEPIEEPVRKTTRGRAAAAATTSATSATTATTRRAAATTRKNVTFQEPEQQDKENVLPPRTALRGKSKEPETESGLRAKPVRRPVTSRTTKTTAKTESVEEKKPLSPKKPTQMPSTAEVVSDDELATTEKTPIKPLTKSPIRLPANMTSPIKRLDFTSSIVVNRVAIPDPSASLMGSPARRPPTSPIKDTFKTSPKRLNFGTSMSVSMSPTKAQASLSASTAQSPFKASLLQSPAKRPPSPMKMSMGSSAMRDRIGLTATPKVSAFSLIALGGTPRTLNKSAMRPAHAQTLPGPLSVGKAPAQKASRMSSILPRDFDPALQSPVKNCAGPRIIETVDEAPRDQEAASATAEALMGEDPMLVDAPEDMEGIFVQQQESQEQRRSTTPTNTPPRHSIGAFHSLNLRDDDPFAAGFEESDSEDELACSSPERNAHGGYGASPSAPRRMSMPISRGSPAKVVHLPPRTPRTAAGAQSARGHSAKGGQCFTPLFQRRATGTFVNVNVGGFAPPTSTKKKLFATSAAARALAEAVEEEAPRTVSPVKNSFFEDAICVSEAVIAAQMEMEVPEAEAFENVGEEEGPPVGEEDELDVVGFAPVVLDEEDLELAAEADEMSLVEFEQPAMREAEEEVMEEVVREEILVEEDVQGEDELHVEDEISVEDEPHIEDELYFEERQVVQEVEAEQDLQMHEPPQGEVGLALFEKSDPISQALSEASQEYADENAAPLQEEQDVMPIDPTLLALAHPEPQLQLETTPQPSRSAPLAPATSQFVTPVRSFSGREQRVVHTVSKVPLKPAADDSPLAPLTIHKQRAATVARLPAQRHAPLAPLNDSAPRGALANEAPASAAGTPSRSTSGNWSAAATPVRTPRSDISNEVLKGAVVYVDVHTTEGADASAVFVELLTQMGAKCVKTWGWNPHGSSEEAGEKIGITHVVFKDGGKRTMEKVREAGGVVSCVGVGWVLEYVPLIVLHL
jgi:hypothetical protein